MVRFVYNYVSFEPRLCGFGGTYLRRCIYRHRRRNSQIQRRCYSYTVVNFVLYILLFRGDWTLSCPPKTYRVLLPELIPPSTPSCPPSHCVSLTSAKGSRSWLPSYCSHHRHVAKVVPFGVVLPPCECEGKDVDVFEFLFGNGWRCYSIKGLLK